jgi:hypothetical protein
VLHIHDSNINELDANYTNVESQLNTVTKYAIGELPDDQEALNNSFRIIQDHNTRRGSENLLAAITMLQKQLNEIHTALMDLLVHDMPIQSLHPRLDKNSAGFPLSSTLQTPTATIHDFSAFFRLYPDAFLERPSERLRLVINSSDRRRRLKFTCRSWCYCQSRRVLDSLLRLLYIAGYGDVSGSPLPSYRIP